MLKVPPLAVTQLGSCASSGRAWRLWLARHTPRERPGHWAPSHCLGCLLTASKVAHLTAFDHPGGSCSPVSRGRGSRRPRWRPSYNPNPNPDPNPDPNPNLTLT
eukprot:scaffold50443_cov36-Phaeocystis_antarctica.AAC.1